MDPLTHTLLGASCGYVAFGKKLGRTAAAVGGLAAFVPDADVFIRSDADPLLAIEFHRHFTHSLLFAPIGAALIAGLWLIKRSARPHAKTLWTCAFFAYASHCLLDAATSYGTLLFWPLTRIRFGWDFISIIDLFITVPLAIGLGFALVKKQRAAAVAGLAFAAAYFCGGIVQHARATHALETLAKTRGHRPDQIEVMPTMANNLVWRALYVHEDRIYSDRIRVGWFSSATVREGWSLPLVRHDTLTPEERARDQHRSFERFAWFSEGWVARSLSDSRVLGDMRYSLSSEAFDPIWGIRFTPPGAATDVAWVNRTRDRKIDPGELWREIVGRDPRFQPLP